MRATRADRWRPAAAWGLGVILLATGLGKLLDIPGFAGVLADYRLLPAALLLPAAILVTTAELAAGVALLAPATRRPAAALAGLLALLNIGVLSLTLARGIRLSNCGCFGVFFPRPLAWWSPLEDAVLLALALLAGRPAR